MNTATRFVLALLAFVAGCAFGAEKLPLHGKGMELYSWKTNTNDWCFSLIVGVNNRKPVLGITDVQQFAVVGLPALKVKLSQLSKGEHVYWFDLAKEPLPRDTEKDLRDFCRAIEVELEYIAPPNKSPEPTAVGPFSSAFAVHVVGRRCDIF